jgi:hypothetical protein
MADRSHRGFDGPAADPRLPGSLPLDPEVIEQVFVGLLVILN